MNPPFLDIVDKTVPQRVDFKLSLNIGDHEFRVIAWLVPDSTEVSNTAKIFFCCDKEMGYTEEYKGDELRGKKHGWGEQIIYRNNRMVTMKGKWENDFFIEGKRSYTNGREEIGTFNSLGQLHGEDCVCKSTKEGSICTGKFENGRFWEGVREVQYTATQDDGSSNFKMCRQVIKGGNIYDGTILYQCIVCHQIHYSVYKLGRQKERTYCGRQGRNQYHEVYESLSTSRVTYL